MLSRNFAVLQSGGHARTQLRLFSDREFPTLTEHGPENLATTSVKEDVAGESPAAVTNIVFSIFE
jgi:hypothetical protein